MDLSVIIAAHNEESNLDLLLGKLTSCTSKLPVQIQVVLSEGTTDNSAQVCKKYHVNCVNSSATQRSMQMNEGAKLSTSPWLFFLHADVIPPDNFYESLTNAIAEGYEIALFSYQFKDANFLLKINSSTTNKVSWVTGGGDQGLFIKRTVFEELNGFDDYYVIMEDFDMFRRFKDKYPFKIIDNPLTVSNRKYKENSYVRVNLVNLWAMCLFNTGKNPERIKRFCKKWLK